VLPTAARALTDVTANVGCWCRGQRDNQRVATVMLEHIVTSSTSLARVRRCLSSGTWPLRSHPHGLPDAIMDASRHPRNP